MNPLKRLCAIATVSFLSWSAECAVHDGVIARFVIPPAREMRFDGDLNLDDLFGKPGAHDYIVINGDTIRFDFAANVRGHALTEKDYEDVANDLGVEVAAIKAIVEIETGKAYRGFNPDSTVVVNFNYNVFCTMASRRKINLGAYRQSHPMVFAAKDSCNTSRQNVQHALLRQAMSIDTVAAVEATFWGMFQIGGFNWKRCGADSPAHFVELMSRNERDQLELFANFIRNSGLLPHLRSKNWIAFARGYNGPSFEKNSYHSRLLKAYKKFSVNKS